MQFEVKERPATEVAFVRHIGPYEEVGSAWQALCQWAGPKGLLGPKTQTFSLCYDDPEVTPKDKIRYEACIPVAIEVQAEGKVGRQRLAAGRYAVALHRGSYAGLQQSYDGLCGAIAEKGIEIRSEPSIEVYLNDPNTTPEAELRVEIWMPVS